MTAVMIMPAVVMVARPANDTSDPTHDAADARADRTAHDPADRSRRAITAIRAFLRAADDALCMPGQRCGEQHQKRQGRCPRKGSFRRIGGGWASRTRRKGSVCIGWRGSCHEIDEGVGRFGGERRWL